MKIYIATKFENQDAFRELKGLLESAGHTITHDWTKESTEGVPFEKLNSYLTGCAYNDYVGVKRADALVFIPVEAPMAGAWVEIGIAIADNKRVIVIDNGLKSNIFFNLPGVVKVPDITYVAEALRL